MTNTEKLRKKIGDKGLKLKYVAEQLDLSAYALSLKMDNTHEFKSSEIKQLCKLLGIDDLKEKEDIFFAN